MEEATMEDADGGGDDTNPSEAEIDDESDASGSEAGGDESDDKEMDDDNNNNEEAADKETKDHNGEEEEEDEDNDDEADSSDGSNSSGSDSDSEDDGGNDKNGGMSAYERLRQENVRRNNERLAALGLASKDGGGVLGKKPPSQQQKKRRTSTTLATTTSAAPSRRSRRSTQTTISYAESSLAKADNDSSKPAEAVAVAPKPEKRGRQPPKDDRSQRMARPVYDEFQRITTHKKLMLREAEKNKKSAETEVKHWQKKAAAKEKRVQKQMEVERALLEQQEELKTYGSSLRGFVHTLDRRAAETSNKIRLYDSNRLAAEQRVELEARRLEKEHGLKLLDSLDAFPKAMKEASKSLSSFLLDCAPKDPPPQRRNKRTREEETKTEEPKHKKSKNGERKGEATESAAKASQASETVLEKTTEEKSPPCKDGEEGKAKKKRELNVGGWVSPSFGPSIDRAWLQKNTAHSQFHPSTYVPQPGDTVLYYPSGHREFLRKHPDHLALKKISRCPLWDRAVKERNKLTKKKQQEEEPASDEKSDKTWWTDSWISEVEAKGHIGNLMRYPLVCRVFSTQAEYPPDPTPKVNGTWTTINTKGTKGKKKVPLRLAVSLRPLTALLPPAWTESGPVENCKISLPPQQFTVVTFPSSTPPFLVPFAWAYIHNHSLALNDDVTQSKPARKAKKEEPATSYGKISSFDTLNSPGDDVSFGSFRLSDKLEVIATVLEGQAKKSVGSPKQAADDGKAKCRPVPAIPTQDAFVICEFFASLLSMNRLAIKNRSWEENEELSSDLVNLILSTLPLWKGVSVMRHPEAKKSHSNSAWDLKSLRAQSNDDALSSPQKELMDFGFVPANRTLGEHLTQKLEFSLLDYLKNTPEAEVFRPLVTDNVAQYYSCAVPITMYFERILDRLKQRKGLNGTPKCYYRSLEAVMQDLNAIQDNCCLYNSPNSEIVTLADKVIPAVKKILTSVASIHAREQKEKLKQKLKQEDEKRKFLAACVSSDSSQKAKETPRSQGKSYDPFLEPFKGALYRDWIQSMIPDITSTHNEQTVQQNSFPQWMPQAGDPVLYSCKLHKKFMEAHCDSLNKHQCILPDLKKKAKACANQGDDRSPIESSSDKENHDNNNVPDESEDVFESEWLLGSIMYVRAEFPRARKEQERKEEGFATDSPILAVALQFPSVDSTETTVVYWRPCRFLCNSNAESDLSCGCCKVCGVPLATSFLCPSWANQFGRSLPDDISVSPSDQGNLPGAPAGIPKDEALALEINLSLLKRRCMNGVPADQLDRNLTPAKVKIGYLPSTLMVEHKSLPSFEDLIKSKPPAGGAGGVRMEELDASPLGGGASASLMELAVTNFIPPWLPLALDANRSKDDTTTLHDSLSPWPNLCLELVLLRLRNGYYRSPLQLRKDIFNAYATSIILCLASDAKRKKNPISIKKLAGVLKSRNYVPLSGVSMEAKKPKKAKKAKKKTQEAKSPTSPQKVSSKDSKKGHATSPAKQKKLGKEKENQDAKSPSSPQKVPPKDSKKGHATSPAKQKKLGKEKENQDAKSPSSPQKAPPKDSKKGHATSPAKQKKLVKEKENQDAKSRNSSQKVLKDSKKGATAGAEKQKKLAKEKGPTIPKKKKKTPGKGKGVAKEKSNKSGNMKKNDKGPTPGKPKKQPVLKLRKSALSEEENMWLSRLEKVRRLYAAALVCISDVSHFQHVNALLPMSVSRPLLRQKMLVITPQDHEAAGARHTLVTLLAALGKEIYMNRYPLAPTESPTMKIKITVEGEIIKGEVPASTLNPSETVPAEAFVSTPNVSESTEPSAAQGEVPAHVGSTKSESNKPSTVESTSELFPNTQTAVSNGSTIGPPAAPTAGAPTPLGAEPQSSSCQTTAAIEGTESTEPSAAQGEVPAHVGSTKSESNKPSTVESTSELFPNTQTAVSNGSTIGPPAAPTAGAPTPLGAKPQSSSCQTIAAIEGTPKYMTPNCVMFSQKDLEEDFALTRTFFGKPGRMFPCIRCQVAKRSLLFCRVIKAHSNIDFDLAENFKSGGGLDRLFRILLKQPEPPVDAAVEQLVASNSQSPSSNTLRFPPDATKMNDSKGTEEKAVNADNNDKPSSDHTKKPQSPAGPSNVNNDDKSGSDDTKKPQSPADRSNVDNDDKPSSDDTKKPQSPAGLGGGGVDSNPTDKQEQSSNVPPANDAENAKADVNQGTAKEQIDPRDLYRRARCALDRANELLVSAKKYSEAPPRLSVEWATENFPTDPSDGKWEYCFVCGKSGDLLMCETERCPTCCHPTCVNFDEIPEDDWFCGRCTVKEGGNSEEGEGSNGETDPKNGPSAGTIPPIVSYDEDGATELTKELKELFVIRNGHVKKRPGKSKEVAVDSTEQPDSKTEEQSKSQEEKPKEIVKAKPKPKPKKKTPVPVQPIKLQLGTEFKKKFGSHGYFNGKVTGMPTEETPFYGVTYEDGDQEDLTEKELIALLTKKKRGRPPKSENKEPPEPQNGKKAKVSTPEIESNVTAVEEKSTKEEKPANSAENQKGQKRKREGE